MLRVALGLGLTVSALGLAAGAPPAPAPTKVLQSGDSITFYTALSSGWDSYARTYAAQQPQLNIRNSAVGGSSLGAPGDTSPTNSCYARLADDLAFDPDVATILIGANDFTPSDPSGYVERVLAYTDQFKAIGAKVIACTILPRTGRPGWNAARATANALIRAAKTSNRIHDVVDFDTIPVGQDGAENDAALYPDGLHPSLSAQISMSQVYGPVVNHWMGVANEPQGFAFAPVNGAVAGADTPAASAYTVKGLYPGEARPFSVAGGKVSKNGGAASTDVGTVVTGDTLLPINTASTEPAGTHDTIVTIGATSATFTVQTAGAGARDWVPTDLGGKLRLWLEPETLSGADDANIDAWPDSSGNNFVVSGDNGSSARPVVRAGAIGAYRAAYITQAPFNPDPAILVGRTSSTTLFVAKLDSDPAEASGSPTGGWGQADDFYNYVNGGVYSGYATNTRRDNMDPADSLAAWHIASFHSAPNDWRFDINGKSVASFASNTVAMGTTPKIGRSAGAQARVQLIEFVDCTGLSAGERAYVEGYLAWKYGLVALLPNNHPWKAEKPTI